MLIAVVALLALILVVVALQLWVWLTLLGHVNRGAAAAVAILENGRALIERLNRGRV